MMKVNLKQFVPSNEDLSVICPNIIYLFTESTQYPSNKIFLPDSNQKAWLLAGVRGGRSPRAGGDTEGIDKDHMGQHAQIY